MLFFSNLKTTKRKYFVVILILIFVIVLSIGSILHLDNSAPNNAVKTNYSEYDTFKQTFISLASDSSLADKPDYIRMMSKLTLLEDNSLSEKNRYQALVSAGSYLETLYMSTNNHKLYGLTEKMSIFAQKNFPKFYKKTYFMPTICVDSICAKNPQPKEILKIVDEIEKSSIPEVVKDSFVQDLLNPGYINDNQVENKVLTYAIVSGILRTSGALTDVGLNEKLSDELNSYLQKTYPELYKKYARVASPTPVQIK